MLFDLLASSSSASAALRFVSLRDGSAGTRSWVLRAGLPRLLRSLTSCQRVQNTAGWLNARRAVFFMAGGGRGSARKVGDPADYPEGHGPQGDAVRIYNHVRLGRGDSSEASGYPIVDTGPTRFFDNTSETTAPAAGAAFTGLDASLSGLQPASTDNGDGTVSDDNPGLTWVKVAGDKMTYAEADAGAASCTVGGHSDWRLRARVHSPGRPGRRPRHFATPRRRPQPRPVHRQWRSVESLPTSPPTPARARGGFRVPLTADRPQPRRRGVGSRFRARVSGWSSSRA